MEWKGNCASFYTHKNLKMFEFVFSPKSQFVKLAFFCIYRCKSVYYPYTRSCSKWSRAWNQTRITVNDYNLCIHCICSTTELCGAMLKVQMPTLPHDELIDTVERVVNLHGSSFGVFVSNKKINE